MNESKEGDFDLMINAIVEDRLPRFEKLKYLQKSKNNIYKVKSKQDLQFYALKEVELIIQKNDATDPLEEIYNSEEYNEVQTLSQITSDNIIRYFSSWFELYSPDDNQKFLDYQEDYKAAKSKGLVPDLKQFHRKDYNQLLDNKLDIARIKMIIQMELCEDKNLLDYI